MSNKEQRTGGLVSEDRGEVAVELDPRLRAITLEHLRNNSLNLDWRWDRIDFEESKFIFNSGSLDDYIGSNRDYATLEYVEYAADECIEQAQESGLEPCDIDEFELATVIMENMTVDDNLGALNSRLPSPVVYAVFYSNYDNCNSMDDPDDKESYLGDVFRRLRGSVDHASYAYEFRNGAYGGALFMLAWRMGFIEALDICNRGDDLGMSEERKAVLAVPAGTRFGFHSSLHGATTPFERRTVRDVEIPMRESAYDSVGLYTDFDLPGYTPIDVLGPVDWGTQGRTPDLIGAPS